VAQDGFADAAAIRAALEGSAVDLGGAGWDAEFGHGLVRAAAALLAAARPGGTTRRFDLSSLGATTLGDSYYPSLSADGRVVAYDSAASGLVPGDVDGEFDVYFTDLFTGLTEQASVDSAGAMVPESAGDVEISADGRFATFTSISGALVAGDTNLRTDVFVRDRALGITTLESPGAGGAQSNGHSSLPAISADGERVVFHSKASNLVSGDSNGQMDVFLRDRAAGTTTLLSIGPGGIQGDGASTDPQISADGRWVVFESTAANLASGDGNGAVDVFLSEVESGALTLVSRGLAGTAAAGGSFDASISGDGARVCFHSDAADLVPGDGNGLVDVFVWERATGTIARASVSSTGAEADGGCTDARIAGGGAHVAFYSSATNLVAGDSNGLVDCFVRDLMTGTTERVSLTAAGAEIVAPVPTGSTGCGISWDGRLVAFESKLNSLVPGDVNANYDLFVRDRRTSAGWFDLGAELDGASGAPTLEAWGGLASSGSTLLRLRGLQPLAIGAHAIGVSRLDLPLFGGVLVPSLDVLLPFAADAAGERSDVLGWPTGLAAGLDVYVQSWALDGGAPQGLAATRALWARTH
jgi:Tol biopolymer transport system component